MKLLSDFDNGKADQWIDKVFRADQIIQDEISVAINRAQTTGEKVVLKADINDENKINIIQSRLRGAEVVPKISESKNQISYTFQIDWQENLDDDIDFFLGEN